MFDLFGSQKLKEVQQSVAQSFSKVREDTDALHQWVQYLHQQNQTLEHQNGILRNLVDEQKLALNELKVTVQHMPKTAADVRQIVENHVDLDPVFRRLKHIEQRIEMLELKRQHALHARPLAVERPTVQSVQVEKPRTALKEKLMKKLARNSKEYIKNMVVGLVHKYGKIQALALREIVVDEQGLCSKSSFYRILSEMEKQGTLGMEGDGRHTVYVASQR